MWTLESFTAAVEGKLIVSCQAPTGHPLRDTATIVHLALAAQLGGATAIRCGGYGGLADISAVVDAVTVPVIGLTKEGRSGVVITPTVASAVAVAEAGATIVAIDATGRDRPDGSMIADSIDAVHQAGAFVMADIATLIDGESAIQAGADILSTTLSGYTDDSPVGPEPDVSLIGALRHAFPDAVITAEGRYHRPGQAAAAIQAGATAVIVGTAITDAVWITRQFVHDVTEAASRV
ncbi:MAG: putative N-acetylmannosamine-6-phosphate 2-epimerase [Nakamurella sp.]